LAFRCPPPPRPCLFPLAADHFFFAGRGSEHHRFQPPPSLARGGCRNGRHGGNGGDRDGGGRRYGRGGGRRTVAAPPPVLSAAPALTPAPSPRQWSRLDGCPPPPRPSPPLLLSLVAAAATRAGALATGELALSPPLPPAGHGHRMGGGRAAAGDLHRRARPPGFSRSKTCACPVSPCRPRLSDALVAGGMSPMTRAPS